VFKAVRNRLDIRRRRAYFNSNPASLRRSKILRDFSAMQAQVAPSAFGAAFWRGEFNDSLGFCGLASDEIIAISLSQLFSILL
jgi:hypothetical protein